MTDKTIAASHAAANAALERAREELATFERELVAAKARQASLTATRQKLARAGLRGGGSARDQRDLAAANEEALRIGMTIQNFESAIKETREAVADAEDATAREGFRVRAAAALDRVAELETHGARVVAALSEFLDQYGELITVATEIRQTRVGRWPSAESFELSIRSSLQQALSRHRLQTEPLLVRRRDLDQVLAQWIGELQLSLERAAETGEYPAAPVMDYGKPPGPDPIEGEQFLTDEAAE